MKDDAQIVVQSRFGDGTGTDAARARRAAVPMQLSAMTEFVETLFSETDVVFEGCTPDPYLSMATHLMRSHLDGRTVTGTSLVAASGVPYATGMRKLRDLIDAGLIEQRPRTRTGKSFSLHPSAELLDRYTRFADRLQRLCSEAFAGVDGDVLSQAYYFGGSYMEGQVVGTPAPLSQPLNLPGGLRGLVHGDPTFMVMKDLKRQFEQILGTEMHQRAFSIDRLRDEALRNSARKQSRYDLIAVDLPWIGEFASRGVLLPLDDVMDPARLDPGDFHTAGWRAAHWGGRPYAVPSQTTPEMLFYRADLFEAAGLTPPADTEALLACARHFHDPDRGRYGIAWNAARGTALGHTFVMACADFGHPIVKMPPVAGGFDTDALWHSPPVLQIDHPASRDAAEFLRCLLDVSPPDILRMSWYERIRPYADGRVPMAYGYTLLAPYFERDPDSPAHGRTGFLPHPPAPGCTPVAPVGGYALGIPANLPEERREAAAEALIAFTSAEAQKLYVLNGSRTSPRHSVGADPEVQAASTIFQAVDEMSWRDELQFWPRPPIPGMATIMEICGEEIHDMLRGQTDPDEALGRAQARAEEALRDAGAHHMNRHGTGQ